MNLAQSSTRHQVDNKAPSTYVEFTPLNKSGATHLLGMQFRDGRCLFQLEVDHLYCAQSPDQIATSSPIRAVWATR